CARGTGTGVLYFDFW
nr:immunoglobulin heavy chain junction region [Mus musculus]